MSYAKKLKRIKRLVESHLELNDIKTRSRRRDYVCARFLYFKIAYNTCRTSLSKIADIVDRDHATVIHGIKQFDDLVQYNKVEFKYLSDAYANITSIMTDKDEHNFLDLSNIVTKLDRINDDINVVRFSITKILDESKQNIMGETKTKVGNT